jgi:Protein of unknown function (DUF2778)
VSVRCSFWLNNKETSFLYCQGFGSVKAFSGTKDGRDNPRDTAMPNIGPLPAGTYYLVDRQSGGTLGWLRDWIESHTLSTDHTKWSCFGTSEVAIPPLLTESGAAISAFIPWAGSDSA